MDIDGPSHVINDSKNRSKVSRWCPELREERRREREEKLQKRLRPGIPGYQRKHFTFTFSESCRKALAAAESLSDSSEDEADTEASKRDIQLSTPVRERSNRRSRLTLRPGVGREIPRFRFHFTPIPPSSSDSEEEEQRFSNLTHFTAIEGLPERWLTKPAEMPYSQVETVPNEDNCEKMFSQMSLEKRNQVQPFEASPKGIDCDESISGQPPIDPFWQEQPLDISISEDAIRTTHQNLSQSQPFQMQPENEIQMPEIDASVQEIPEYIAPIEVEEDAVSIAGNQRQQSVNDLQTHVVHAEVDSWMLPDMADDDPRDEDDTMRIEGASEVDRPNVPPRTKRRTTTLRMRKEYKRSSLLGSDVGTQWINGRRRSTRNRCEPLRWWEGECKVYGREHNTLITVTGYVKKACEPEGPKQSTKKGRSKRPR